MSENCPYCGQPLEDKDKDNFCDNCGAYIERFSAQVVEVPDAVIEADPERFGDDLRRKEAEMARAHPELYDGEVEEHEDRDSDSTLNLPMLRCPNCEDPPVMNIEEFEDYIEYDCPRCGHIEQISRDSEWHELTTNDAYDSQRMVVQPRSTIQEGDVEMEGIRQAMRMFDDTEVREIDEDIDFAYMAVGDGRRDERRVRTRRQRSISSRFLGEYGKLVIPMFMVLVVMLVGMPLIQNGLLPIIDNQPPVQVMYVVYGYERRAGVPIGVEGWLLDPNPVDFIATLQLLNSTTRFATIESVDGKALLNISGLLGVSIRLNATPVTPFFNTPLSVITSIPTTLEEADYWIQVAPNTFEVSVAYLPFERDVG